MIIIGGYIKLYVYEEGTLNCIYEEIIINVLRLQRKKRM